MKVGMITWTYWPGAEGGAERQCRKITKQLATTGVDTVVFSSLSCLGMRRTSKDGSVVVRRYGLFCPFSTILRQLLDKLIRSSGNKHEKLFRSLAFWLLLPFEYLARLSFIIEFFLAHTSNNFKLDIIHVHETAWLAGFGALLGKRWNIPVVCKVRNTPALEVIGYDTPFRMVWSRLRNNAMFIALHDALKLELITAGIADSQVTIVPNGVEVPDLSARKPVLGEVVYIGNFSQGVSHKAFDTLFKGWAEVIQAFPDAHLTVVGGGDHSRWERLTEDLGCNHTTTFTGAVENPQDYLRKAQVFVLPSRYEGMSNALLEAQSWGIACVVSGIPANTAVVTDGVNGQTFTVDDYTAMALKIVNLLSEPDLCAVLGRNARRKVEEVYSLERIIEKLKTVYNTTVLEGKLS